MTEKQIEAKLVHGVKTLGGRAYKFVSPGNVGVPDRIVFLPGGHVLLAELKTETGELSRMQKHQISVLQNIGAEVWVVWGEAGMLSFLARCRELIGGDAL